MLVEEVMMTDLVTCSVEKSLHEGAERLLKNGVGSVIIRKDDMPVGIVTETDALYAGYVTQRPFTEIPIQKVMSAPLVTISPQKTLRRATQRMYEENIKKLVVVEDLDPVGIITTQDMIEHYHDLKAEIHDLVQPYQFSFLDLSASNSDVE